MGLFGNAKSCSICGQVADGKQLSDGHICKACISRCGSYQVFSWKQVTTSQAKERISCNTENEKLNMRFSPTQRVEKYFEIDENNGLWKVPSFHPSLVFSSEEIINFELLQNGDSITKGGLGSSIVGGALFGGVGAIVGSNVGKKKTVQEITEFRIKIITRNPFYPEIYINLLVTGKTKSNGIVFKSYIASAQKILSLLTIITAKDEKKEPSASSADEILKFKHLLDEGIITQEEFEAKKKQLLGL